MALALVVFTFFILFIAYFDSQPVLGVSLPDLNFVRIVTLCKSASSAFLGSVHKSIAALIKRSLDKSIQLVKDDGLGDGVVHAGELALAGVLLALVAREPDDQDGLVVLSGLCVPNLLGGLVAVEHGHLAVHKDQFHTCVLGLLQQEALVGLLSIVSHDELYAVLDDEGHLLQHLLDNELVHLVIVHYENCFSGHQLRRHFLQLEGSAFR